MSKVIVELGHDTVDSIIVQELEWQLNYFKDEIIKHAQGGGVHPSDLEDFILDYAATKRVLERYTV
jgi:hypothetical protein